MTLPRVTCPCGHSWEYTGEGPPPDDLREICPVCARIDSDGQTLTPPGLPLPADAALTLQPGKQIAGFEVIEELNRGGMGVIYKARQLGLDRIVALKVIAPNRLGNPEARKRFQQEVKTAALLNHENIVHIYTTDLDGPIPYLAMEYIPGIDLYKLVKQAGPLDPADACYYVHQAAHGLQHAFERGLVHRDIKPANLMVTPSPFDREAGKTGRLPQVKILDMGLARVVSEADAPPSPGDMTRDGIFLGTPDYIAPEQAEDSRQADIRADIYSLGSTLYYLLTGEIPFPGATLVQKLRKQMTEPAPSAAAKRPEVPVSLDAVLRRMMARNPAERIQTPAELIDALDRVMRGGVVPAGARGTGKGTGSHLTLPVAQLPPAGGSGFNTAKQVKAHTSGIHSIAVATGGQVLLTGGLDGAIKVWHAAKMKEVRTFKGDIGAVEQVAVAPGGRWAASCSVRLTVQDMGVQLWDVTTGAERRRLRGPGDNIRCVAISPDGKRVAAGSADQSIWVWSVESGGPKTVRLTGHAGAVTGVVFLPSGDSLLTAGQDGTVRQWDLDEVCEKGALDAGVGPITGIAYAARGKRLAVAGRTLAVRQRNGRFARFDGHDGPVHCVALSPDGVLVASGGADKTVRLWQVEDGTEVARYTGHTKPVWAVAFGPDGGVVYSGGEGGTLRRWPVSIQVA